MLQVTPKTSPQEIFEYVKSLREQKGKERETLLLIEKALSYGHDFVINLLWEQTLTFQHIVMTDATDKKSIRKMEESVLMAKFYIEKYKLTKWKSRLYRFLGRVNDYKGEFKKSVANYKEAIRLSKFDEEPFRKLELNGLLSFALIMIGKTNFGYNMARKTFNDFESLPIGVSLKKHDYQTWVIWRSGIVVRTIEAFVNKKINYDKQEFENWVLTVEKDLSKGDFSYRKMEIDGLKQRLLKN